MFQVLFDPLLYCIIEQETIQFKPVSKTVLFRKCTGIVSSNDNHTNLIRKVDKHINNPGHFWRYRAHYKPTRCMRMVSWLTATPTILLCPGLFLPATRFLKGKSILRLHHIFWHDFSWTNSCIKLFLFLKLYFSTFLLQLTVYFVG